MTQIEVGDALLLLVQLLLDVRELVLQELSGSYSLAVADLGVLHDVRRRQHIGDMRRHPWIPTAVTDRETNHPADSAYLLVDRGGLQPDVAPELLVAVVEPRPFLPQPRVDIERRAEVAEPVPTHELLLDPWDAAFECDRRPDE